jgi:hypothetical protein
VNDRDASQIMQKLNEMAETLNSIKYAMQQLQADVNQLKSAFR